MRTSDQINELSEALSLSRLEFAQPKKDRNGQHGGYSTLTAVQDATVPGLSKHGLAIVQAASGNGKTVVLETRLLHKSGQWLATTISVPVEIRESNKGKKILSDAQAMGVAITYHRRYAWAAMCGVASEVDTDGAVEAWTPPGTAAAQAVPAPAQLPATQTPTEDKW